MEASGPIEVFLADANALFREAVKSVIQSQEGMRVVGEASDAAQLIAGAERTRPDVIVLDSNLPGDSIERTITLVHESGPYHLLMLLSIHEQEILVTAVQYGVTGFVTKESPLSELIAATEAVHGGATIVPQLMLGPLLQALMSQRRHQEEGLRRMSRLTRREKEVLALLADGADNDSIAEVLVISPQTARTHIQNILAKLDVHSRLEAATLAMQKGFSEELAAHRQRTASG
jgi:DNA-binding NarL/FixJ family response regulator